MNIIYPERAIDWPPVIYRLQQALQDTPEVYLVGGTVRDAYRGRAFKDIDLTCAGDGQPIARRIANAFKGDYYPLDAERGIGRAIIEFQGERWLIDVAAFRGADLLADLQDRDFTVNALAVALDSDLEGIYDPMGGLDDIHHKILRRCSPNSIANDPIRALRAVRQSLTYGFSIEPATRQDMKIEGMRLLETSPERVRDEFFALLNSSKPQGGIMVLDALGFLKLILPEVEAAHHRPYSDQMTQWRYMQSFLDHLFTLLLVISPRRDDNVAANASFGTFVYMLDRFRGFLQRHVTQHWANERTHQMLLLFSAIMLFTAESPDVALERGQALRLSSQELRRLEDILRWKSLADPVRESTPPSPRQIYRYWRQTGEAGVDILLFAIADYLVSHSTRLSVPHWTSFLLKVGQYLEGYEQAMNLKPMLTGNDVMQVFSLKPGPIIGEILENLREAQALGEFQTPEAGLTWAEAWLNTRL